jgi:hypothetical protein
MQFKRSISFISAFVSIVMALNIVIPALSHCLLLTNCDMMEMPEATPYSSMNHTMDMMNGEHQADERTSDHCESGIDEIRYSLTHQTLMECVCLKSSDTSLASIHIPSKTKILAPFVGNLDINYPQISDVISEHNLYSFASNHPPPQLFIKYQSLLM